MWNHLFQYHSRSHGLNAAACLATILGAAGVSCTRFTPEPAVAMDWIGASQQVDEPIPAPIADQPIEVVRQLKRVADHGVGRSGDYCVEWSYSLAHPAQVPLVLTQHYESLAEIQHDTADVMGTAAYTEIVGLIPAGQTRPVITGTAEAVGALLEYARVNPATPMVLPSRAQLRAFADRQVELTYNLADRQGVAAYYEVALLAYDDGENDVNDQWSFPGAQVSSVGTATISGRLILYEATPELLKELDAWDTTGGREHLEYGHLEISPDEFVQIFRPAPPLPGMGSGGSGDFLSRSDQDGGAKRMAKFKEFGHEIATEQLLVAWQDTDRPVMRFSKSSGDISDADFRALVKPEAAPGVGNSGITAKSPARNLSL